MLNGLDLFSGIGGLSIALSPWVIPRAYCEKEPYAQAVLLSRMRDGSIPWAPIWDDVRSLSERMVGPEIDIIYGGFPCQDVSIAGAQVGLDGERSKLVFQLLRLVRELRPSFVFLENTPGLLSMGVERIYVELVEMGFDIRWTIVSAGEMGACHLRERWWLCAHSSSAGLQKSGHLADTKGEHRRPSRSSADRLVQGDIQNEPLSRICGMDDGLRPKTHRTRALGNAVVPLQAREAFMRLAGLK